MWGITDIMTQYEVNQIWSVESGLEMRLTTQLGRASLQTHPYLYSAMSPKS